MGIRVEFYEVSEKGEIVTFYCAEEDDIKEFNTYIPNKLKDTSDSFPDYEATLKKICNNSEDYIFFSHSSDLGIRYKRKNCEPIYGMESLGDEKNFITYKGKCMSKIKHFKGANVRLLNNLDKIIDFDLAMKMESKGNYLHSLICTEKEAKKLYKIIEKDYKLEFKEEVIDRFEQGRTFIYIN